MMLLLVLLLLQFFFFYFYPHNLYLHSFPTRRSSDLQFIEPDSPTKVGAFLVLGLTFLSTGTVWCLVLALGASRVRSFFASRPRALQGLSQASGALFIVLGLRLAASKQ